MTRSSPRADPHERILDEAARLFIQQGYQGVSMRAIAEAVGVSKAGLYYHFEDKEALFLGVLLSNIEALERLVAEVHDVGDIRSQLRTLLGGIASHMTGRRRIIQLAEQDVVHLSPEAQRAMYGAYRAAFIDPIHAILQRAQARGELRPVDTEQLTRLVLGLAYPLLSRTREEAEAMVDLVLDVFLDGAAAR